MFRKTTKIPSPLPQVNQHTTNDLIHRIFFEAVTKGDIVVLRRLIPEIDDINTRNSSGQTVLHIACIYGNASIITFLLQEGANVHIQDYLGWTCLHYIARHNYYNIIPLLLSYEVDYTTVDIYGYNALMIACLYGYIETVIKLVSIGINPHQKNIYDDTCIHLASIGGYIDITSFLLSLNCNVNSQGYLGYTPLSLATQYKHWELVRYLVSKGANIDMVDKNGNDIFDIYNIIVRKESHSSNRSSNESGNTQMIQQNQHNQYNQHNPQQSRKQKQENDIVITEHNSFDFEGFESKNENKILNTTTKPRSTYDISQIAHISHYNDNNIDTDNDNDIIDKDHKIYRNTSQTILSPSQFIQSVRKTSLKQTKLSSIIQQGLDDRNYNIDKNNDDITISKSITSKLQERNKEQTQVVERLRQQLQTRDDTIAKLLLHEQQLQQKEVFYLRMIDSQDQKVNQLIQKLEKYDKMNDDRVLLPQISPLSPHSEQPNICKNDIIDADVNDVTHTNTSNNNTNENGGNEDESNHTNKYKDLNVDDCNENGEINLVYDDLETELQQTYLQLLRDDEQDIGK